MQDCETLNSQAFVSVLVATHLALDKAHFPSC